MKFLEKFIMNSKNKEIIKQNSAYQIENYNDKKGYEIDFILLEQTITGITLKVNTIKKPSWLDKEYCETQKQSYMIGTQQSVTNFDVENGIFGHYMAIADNEFDYEILTVVVKEIE